jgi:hypothetical protein
MSANIPGWVGLLALHEAAITVGHVGLGGHGGLIHMR